MVIIRARVEPHAGAVVIQAIAAARDQLYARRHAWGAPHRHSSRAHRVRLWRSSSGATRPNRLSVGGPHTRSAQRLSRRYHTSLSPNPGYAALRPLGFGTTKTAAVPMRSGFGPGPGLAEGPKNWR